LLQNKANKRILESIIKGILVTSIQIICQTGEYLKAFLGGHPHQSKCIRILGSFLNIPKGY
jgi:hypothetical protein